MAVSLTGVQVLNFAMAWVAAGTSGLLAGLVLTAGNLPQALLLLTGGAVADRVGLWRVVLLGYGGMVALLCAFAITAAVLGSPAWLLLGAAAVIGAVEALWGPASAAVPLALVPRAALPRALSARQVVQQSSGFVGPALGGVVVALGGLVLAASLNAVTFALVFVLVLLLRPAGAMPNTPGTASLWQQSLDGVRVVARDPLLRAALLLLFFAAGILLPVVGLLIPVLARQQGWPASTTGWALGGFGLGYAAVALTVSLRGLPRRPGVVAVLGIGLAGAAVSALSVAPVLAAPAATVVIGVGAGGFASSVGPLVLGSAPPEYAARVQALAALTQVLPVLVTNGALGYTADVVGARWVIGFCGLATAAVALVALKSTALRTAGDGGP
ncbi:MFS transporter [Jannaschia sp. R86511]|uniref:MFS transporter n=1 Tax=Jannaschia sp. R86511 TaxID=3093853 RepID=UPI0036D257C2